MLAASRFSLRRWSIPALAGLLVAMGLFLIFGIERQAGVSRFCSVCGVEEQASFWTIRGTHLHVHSSILLVTTPFAKTLASRQLVAPHEHDWIAPVEVPNVTDATAPHLLSSLGDLNAQRTVSFVRNLTEYAEPSLRDNWLHILMQPQNCRFIEPSLFYMGMPAEGFSSKREFLRWIGESASLLRAHIEVLVGDD